MELTVEDLKVGQVYRAKRPGQVGVLLGQQYVNDRQIIWAGVEEVQYDSPAVTDGRRYPRVTKEAFLKWASHTVELPTPDWMTWDEYQQTKARTHKESK